jgi:hypothetical protein
MIKLVAFDLDGTILDNESRTSEKSIATIEQLLAKGLTVASISGRSIRRSQEPLAAWPQLAAALYVGGYNGGVAVGPARDGTPLLHEERLDGELFKELVEFSRAGNFNLICCLFTQDANGIREEYRHSHSVEGLEVFGGPGFVHDEALFERCLTGEIAAPPKIMIVTGEERRAAIMDELQQWLGERVYSTWSIPDRIELMPPHVDKAMALGALTKTLGIGLEQTLAIGDGDNDLPMLKAAGVGILMGNAKPEVRALAESAGVQIGASLEQEGFTTTVKKYVDGLM